MRCLLTHEIKELTSIKTCKQLEVEQFIVLDNTKVNIKTFIIKNWNRK